MILGPIITPACTGADGAGAATITYTKKITGLIYAIYIDYVGDDPATTDVTITTLGTSPNVPSYTILSRANSATSGMLLPRLDTCKASDASALSANDQMVPIDDYPVVTVAQANTGDIIKVWFFMI